MNFLSSKFWLLCYRIFVLCLDDLFSHSFKNYFILFYSWILFSNFFLFFERINLLHYDKGLFFSIKSFFFLLFFKNLNMLSLKVYCSRDLVFQYSVLYSVYWVYRSLKIFHDDLHSWQFLNFLTDLILNYRSVKNYVSKSVYHIVLFGGFFR